MASICVLTTPPSYIDYSPVDGHVTTFVCRGQKYYDRFNGLEVNNWIASLATLVVDNKSEFTDAHALLRWLGERGYDMHAVQD